MDRAYPESFEEAVGRISGAIGRLTSGDATAYIDCWADAADATIFGAWGRIEKGHQGLKEALVWAGQRFGGPGLQSEIVVSGSSGDLGYTVGFESGVVQVDGGPERPMTMRVTHVYRRVDGTWKLAHRHADFPPKDPRESS